MANSQYEYVRNFELPDNLLLDTWIVVRIDGRGFHKLSDKYEFEKPNDIGALNLMRDAARAVMESLPDISLAYGQSDEFSFVFAPGCQLYERRASKLSTTVVSMFSSAYVFHWPSYFPDRPLTFPLPSFDGRAVVYPTIKHLKDYLSWRQADCHINNLYNTTFWALVNKAGMSRAAAEKRLSGTLSADKNNILFEEFGINYNKETAQLKRGTLIYRDYVLSNDASSLATPHGSGRMKTEAHGVASSTNPAAVDTTLDKGAPNFLDSVSKRDATETKEMAGSDAALQVHSLRKPRLCSGTAEDSTDIIGAKGDLFWQEHPWLEEYGNARKKAAEIYFGIRGGARLGQNENS